MPSRYFDYDFVLKPLCLRLWTDYGVGHMISDFFYCEFQG